MSSPLSGFTAVPNPQMLAFMGAQSFIMMYQAGEGWQYGKRRISAMSNEEFNKLTPELVMEKQAVVLRNSLSTIQRSMNDMTPMIRTIVEQYGDFIREIIAAIPQTLSNITQPSAQSQTPQQANLPGVASFITPIIGLVPRGMEQNLQGQQRIQEQVQQQQQQQVNTRQAKLDQIAEIRARGPLQSTNVTLQTRDATSNEQLWNTYNAKKVETLQAIINLKNLVASSQFNVDKWIRLQRNASGVKLTLKTNQKRLADYKASAYRFFTLARNSPNHLIKADANRMINSRLNGL